MHFLVGKSNNIFSAWKLLFQIFFEIFQYYGILYLYSIQSVDGYVVTRVDLFVILFV